MFDNFRELKQWAQSSTEYSYGCSKGSDSYTSFEIQCFIGNNVPSMTNEEIRESLVDVENDGTLGIAWRGFGIQQFALQEAIQV